MKSHKAGHSAIQVSLKFLLREYAEALILAVLLAFIVRSFVVSAYRIPTLAMSPTLLPGDFIFAYKLPFGFQLPFSGGNRVGGHPPNRGEVVIFRCPYDPSVSCIKRVVGLPGDRIRIQGKRLILNGKKATYQTAKGAPLSGEDGGSQGVVVEEAWGGFRHQILIGAVTKTENYGPLVVPPGHLFVLSDNRDHGEDSRKWGLISIRSLEARAGVIWLSLGWEDSEKSLLPNMRWSRVLQVVD
ncbi:MAG: signal peptidase I [Bdellovibrionaceae bacterium]|nr:signal peptidase I [Bdellovibrionales bacterium]MCB9086105.1 signal peptidase I [Pseudobdellovibrionaceae bacterium]